MNKIHITHNPFTVDTQFLINGQEPAQGCKLSSYKESRLQVWVEKLFDELNVLFNGDNHYHITFLGVESDYLDIKAAAAKTEKSGVETELHWVKADPTEQRLEQLKEVIKKSKEHPKFKHYLENNDYVSRSLEEAFNRDFDVYVVATMSAGKSTLINAMLGQDLLPAANEATTANIARIIDNDDMDHFSAKCFDSEGNMVAEKNNVDPSTLKDWNGKSDTGHIDITGNIKAIKERKDVRLVLTDTPGPNNSQDEEHHRKTMSYIQDSVRNPLILYVLNASQLGTNDDRNLLRLVAEQINKGGKQSRDRFIFAVNKMDVFDPESGENIESVLARVKLYLEENGIQSPLLYPISANLTRLLRKDPSLQTRKERADFRSMSDLFEEEPNLHLQQYMPITDRVRHAVNNKGLSPLIQHSGLPAVEAMIDEYIDKYNLPHRIKRIYDAMNKALVTGMNEATLTQQLEQDEASLCHLNEKLKELKKQSEEGFNTGAYIEKLTQEGKEIPRDVEENLIILEGNIQPVIRELKNQFPNKDASVNDANNKIQIAEDKLKFEHQRLTNEYELLFSVTQDKIRQTLQNEYSTYINNIFEGTKKFELPVLEGIKNSVSNFSLALGVEKDDIKEKSVVIGHKKVSASKWYNPFSWGKKKKKKKYGTEEYVNLKDLWQDRVITIESEFEELVFSAREETIRKKDILIEEYIQFIIHEFEPKFAELLESIEEKTNDSKVRQQAINDAKNLQAWIESIKAELDNTLSVKEAI